ncbi:hypothetical protein PXK17_19930 [Phaeobacter gallaeciensis]|uniref:hypothetical protein n=1 Tax=Phaeobacter gallaeciensis TaxID=60890 RepID=UPI00237FCD87|nr:hypothetical protein [Phaeobacter gallaeciensis]MDE4146898.1 hypothetical protein [Phaeobacter gallaeciensis]MDE4163747.1 hypothetical protein [Phaeobacter gallaeciensis]MDE4172214.1 hypothetical protein [Phaeobacter gallaeciensis]MDE4180735.1 hypothetical protein [Phaeobacter gallaeciensis]MDE4189077.1 hypothetical protein [Phaeobacter gallaeciensis]
MWFVRIRHALVLAIGAAHTADASVHDFLSFIDELVQGILFAQDPQVEFCQSPDFQIIGEMQPQRP